MIEWLVRRRSSPGCSPLRPSLNLERSQLAFFLDSIGAGMAPGAYRSVVQKCVSRLRQPSYSTISQEDGLWFDSHMLAHLKLPFPVYIWDITGSVETLTSYIYLQLKMKGRRPFRSKLCRSKRLLLTPPLSL